MKHNRRQLFHILGLVLVANAMAFVLLASRSLANVDITSFTAAGTEDEIVLAWHTETELDTLGFNVWRSETEYTLAEMQEDPFDADTVNIGLIAPTGGTSPADYQLIDDDVEQDVTYFYYLSEIIASNGVEVFHKGPTAASLVINEEIGLPTATTAAQATATQTVNATATPTATATATSAGATPNAPETVTPQSDATLAAAEADTGATATPVPTPTSPVPAPIEETGQDDAYPASAEVDDGAVAVSEAPTAPTTLGSAEPETATQAVASADNSTDETRQTIGEQNSGTDATTDVATTTSDQAESSTTRTALIMGSAVTFVIVIVAIATLILLLLRRRQA